MRRTLILLSLAFSGCQGSGPALRATEPIDPASLILTIRPDGAVIEGDHRFTRDGLRERVGNPGNGRNHRPILLDAPPDETLRCVKDTIEWLYRANCDNLGFRVRTPWGERVVRLPTPLSYPDLRVYDGREEILLVDHREVIEVVARVGFGGAIEVTSVQYTREYVDYPEAGKVLPKDDGHDWKGSHPPCGTWSVDTLREFIQRKDLARQRPYVGLDISWQDRVQDVLLCLSALREAAGSRVEPILRPE